MDRLKGKVSLVTGAASGIGLAIANMFSKEGAMVLITDVKENDGRKAVEDIAKQGGTAEFIRHDVTKEKDWAHVMETVEKKYGRLDVLVNNAGINERGNTETITLQDWKTIIEVNLNSVFIGTQAAIKVMKKKGGGSIVNICSKEGLTGNHRASAYTAAKGGGRLFTKSSAIYCAKEGYNIRINSIHPGVIRTPLLDAYLAQCDDPEGEYRLMVADHPMGSLGDPDDVAYGAVYLASDESKWITGSELVIDGGFTAQ